MSIAMRMCESAPRIIAMAAAVARAGARRPPGAGAAAVRRGPRGPPIRARIPPLQSLTDPGPYGPVGRSAWMDVDWRAHRRFVELDGRAVNVVELGTGDPPIAL